jgi:anti-sigma regulatory factor (Ser/Thr protein kinase)
MAGELDLSCGAAPAGSRVPGVRSWESALPVTARAAGLARLATRAVLGSWQLPLLSDAAVLLVSELVTNAVLHARHEDGTLLLRLELSGDLLRIEVHDTDPRCPELGDPGELDESGFGLVLVATLAAKWGTTGTSDGKVVWAELDVQPPPAR